MATCRKYVLHDLLVVRRLREDAAATEWAHQKTVVANAESQLERCRRELVDYRAWRIVRETEIFEEVMHRTVHPKDLERVRACIQKLRDQESNLRARLVDAEQHLQVQLQKLEDDRQQYLATHRDREKLDEHKSNWLRVANEEFDAAEEKEIEDFKNHMGCLATNGV